MLYEYNRIKSTAVSQNLIYIDEDENQIYDCYDLLGNWKNPYESEYLIAFSPYMNISGLSVTYQFSNLYKSSNLQYSSIEFDPDDGNGYRTLSLSNVPGNINVTYDDTGTYDLKLRVTLTDNTVLLAHSVMVVDVPQAMRTAPSVDPDDSLIVQSKHIYEGYQPWARAYLKLANGHSSLIKPLIFAEGFDPLCTDLIPDQRNGFCTLGNNSITDELGDVYDIIYINWLDSAAPIEANAENLKQVIDWVNTIKSSSAEKSILVGHSMGGLIARYALRTMELNNDVHDVSHYVSFDSPHLGVNVPLGMVYAAQHLYEFYDHHFADIVECMFNVYHYATTFGFNLPDFQSPIEQLLALRTAPSVREMLINYVTPSYQLDNSRHQSFQATLNQLGLPQGDSGSSIKNICISNGGVNNYVTSNFFFNLDIELDLPIIVQLMLHSVFSSITPAMVALIALPTGYSTASAVLQIRPHTSTNINVYNQTWQYSKQFLFNFTLPVFSLPDYHHNALAGSLHLDDANGSYYNTNIEPSSNSWSLLQFASGSLSNVLTSLTGNISYEFEQSTNFMFVPTVSSLYYKGGDLLNQSDYAKGFNSTSTFADDIPFDAYYITNNSIYHAASDVDTCTLRYLCDLSISGPAVVDNGSQFSISGANVSASWGTTAPSYVTISSTGCLSNIGVEAFTVTATIPAGGGNGKVVLKKDVLAPAPAFTGFPTFTLSASGSAPSGDYPYYYDIQMSYTGSIDPRISNQFVYHWGTKATNYSSYTWTTSQNPYFFYTRYNDNTPKQVLCYVSYQGYQTSSQSVTCQDPPLSIIVDSSGNLYSPDDADNPIAKVKSDAGETYVCECNGQTFYFDHKPSAGDLCRELLRDEDFVQKLKTMKPWGSEDSLILDYSLSTPSGKVLYNFILFLYE